MYEHLIFFDGECPFCHRAVRHIIQIDVNKRFMFAPLGGETAREVLIGPQADLKKKNSLVLVEDYQSTERKFWVESRAVFRIYWLVGSWGLIGVLCFLPSFIGDPIYRICAAHRHQFKMRISEVPGPKERFLP